MTAEFWKHAAAVVIGGGLGSFLRFAVGAWVLHHHPAAKFPWATLGVNWGGCLLIGLVYGWVENRTMLGVPLRYFLMTGLLGGFTTFSSFGNESMQLIEKGRHQTAFFYVILSNICGLAAVYLGTKISSIVL